MNYEFCYGLKMKYFIQVCHNSGGNSFFEVFYISAF